MSLNGILALLWLAFCFCFIVGFVYSLAWFEDRAERRKAHRAAE